MSIHDEDNVDKTKMDNDKQTTIEARKEYFKAYYYYKRYEKSHVLSAEALERKMALDLLSKLGNIYK